MYKFVTKEYWSNCLIEAIKAKIKNKNVVIYYCRPIKDKNGFQFMHFMWSDGMYDYDFSDNGTQQLKWYKTFLFKGAIRQFRLGFVKKYSEQRNKRKF